VGVRLISLNASPLGSTPTRERTKFLTQFARARAHTWSGLRHRLNGERKYLHRLPRRRRHRWSSGRCRRKIRIGGKQALGCSSRPHPPSRSEWRARRASRYAVIGGGAPVCVRRAACNSQSLTSYPFVPKTQKRPRAPRRSAARGLNALEHSRRRLCSSDDSTLVKLTRATMDNRCSASRASRSNE